MNRRHFLGGMFATTAVLSFPRMAFARAATDKRFIFIIQRGAADGLSTVVPYGDSAHASLRGAFADFELGGLRLDSFFSLNPALTGIGSLYERGEALFVHAIASSYRSRSHFDGQNMLETGGGAPYQIRDGWGNRLVALLSGEDVGAIALSPTVPTILRGNAPASVYAPSALPDATADLKDRVSSLYSGDEQLHAYWDQALAIEDMAGDIDGRQRANEVLLGRIAGQFLASQNGDRIGVIEMGGWDTHNAQRGRFPRRLGRLDAVVMALREELAQVWNDTLICVATEFGRTAAPNGTLGTDHGTASAAMLIGGAVAGGRVIADWPGLRQANLLEGRDVMPTESFERIAGSALAAHFGLDPRYALTRLFPALERANPAEGLLRG